MGPVETLRASIVRLVAAAAVEAEWPLLFTTVMLTTLDLTLKVHDSLFRVDKMMLLLHWLVWSGWCWSAVRAKGNQSLQQSILAAPKGS
jgi:hypothetical protein